MFQTACGLREKGGWEIAPSEFWSMSPQEWWDLFDVNIGYQLRESQETSSRLKHIYFKAQGGL